MIILTGAAGFIGSNLVARLNAAGRDDLIVVDWLGSHDKWRNIAKSRFQDLVRPEDLPAFLRQHETGIEAVFHLGAISATTAIDGDEIVKHNLRPSMDLWHWCTKQRVPLFYASSAATYGDGSHGFDDTTDPSALQPLNLYGWSKHAFDQWAMRQASRGSSPPRWAGFKFFNVYGPNEYHKGDMMSVAAKNHANVVAQTPIALFKSHRPDFADGEQLRDFVYVKDCCEVMAWFMQSERPSGVYNLGTGRARSFRDLILAVGQACGLAPRIDYVPMPEHLQSKYQYFTQATMHKLRAIGYERPFHTLEEGVRDYVTSHLGTADPYV